MVSVTSIGLPTCLEDCSVLQPSFKFIFETSLCPFNNKLGYSQYRPCKSFRIAICQASPRMDQILLARL